jgi:hypothetical protein
MIYEDGYEVSKLNDKVNDETKIVDVIDWDSRDNVFVYIDGQIFKGISNESHSDVIHRLLNETGSRLRLSDEEVKKKLKTNNVAFGHIINNCAFVDFPTVGANINNVVNACQGFDKVYLYEKKKCVVKRLAMKRLKKADKKQDLFDFYSDIHKDAYGYRPRISKQEFEELTEDDLEKMIDDCNQYIQSEEYREQAEYEAREIERMEQEYIENVKKMKQEQEEQKWRDEDEYYDSLEKSVKQRHQGANQRHQGNVIAKRIIAMTDNIKEIPANTSINAFKSEYDSLIKDGWVLNDYNGENSGVWGEFAYRPAGQGIENPIIYLREIFHFTKKGGYHTCIVVEHKYDTNGNVSKSDYRKYDDMTGRDMKGELTSGNVNSIIDSGYLNELPNAKTYQDAKAEVDNIVDVKQQTI